jgi:transcriptional regulator with XRE-family HTH domain
MKNQVLVAFGGKVRERRLELGLSQESLANSSGLHRTYIGTIERGERNPALVNIARLAQALESTPSELLSGISM